MRTYDKNIEAISLHQGKEFSCLSLGVVNREASANLALRKTGKDREL